MSTPELERDTPPAGEPPPPTTSTRPPRSWRPLVMRLHFYAGIFIAPFLLIATISGGLYAVAPSLEQVVYRDYLHTDSTGPSVPLADQIVAAQQVRPDLTVSAVRPAADAGETTRVMFTDPSLGSSERQAVFVDPVTAESRGELVVYGSSGSLPMRTWISQLHRHLHLGEPGRLYSELAASWLAVIALGGVYLWVDRYRRMRGSARARLFGVDRSRPGRQRTLNWHGATGLWIAVGLIFLSATGLTWSTYAGENVSNLRTSLSWTTPTITSTIGDSGADAAHAGHAGHGGGAASADSDSAVVQGNVGRIDETMSIARQNGIDGHVEVSIPVTTDTATVVAQTRQPWVASNNSISIDSAMGTVVDRLWFSDWPLMAKLASWGIQLHMGLMFGLANQLVLLALAVALGTVIVRGYLMWWKRRPTKRSGLTVAAPPARGGLRRVSPLSAAVLVVAAVAVGWFVPLLGISLLAFLAVDVVVGLTRRVRADRKVLS